MTQGPAEDLLLSRIASLESAGNTIALGRARAELAIIRELSGDPVCAAAAEAALSHDSAQSGMRTLLRRRLHGRGATSILLGHVEAEIAQASEGSLQVSLLAERARLLTAESRYAEASAAWSYVLAHDPRHPAALRGKEATLQLSSSGSDVEWEEAAEHLGRMAEAFSDDPKAAAWLLVERAAILELRLRKVDAARRVLTEALTKDPRVGPVRRALVRHVSRRRDAAALIDLLDEEGRLETDPVRAARLELEAASLAEGATSETGRALLLLERAASRTPTTQSVDLRVLGDLVRLLEAAGRGSEATRWRRARMALIEEGPGRAEELRALARSEERDGNIDAAIEDLEASLRHEDDSSTVVHLDELLASRGRHEARMAIWVTDAARADDPKTRVASLLRAANVAERALARPEEAVRYLRTAWTSQPGHPEVLEALTRLLPQRAPDAEARLRLELYAHAAEVSSDAGHKVAYLEKVALLAEDTVGDFARAKSSYEAILQLEPGRMGALLGLERSAARGKDDRTLARALLAQAAVTRSESDALGLKTRAATAIAEKDPAAALSLADEVLVADRSHTGARELVTKLHEQAGRWALVAKSLHEKLEHTTVRERRDVLLRLAEVQVVRLKTPGDALTTLRHARDSDPEDPRIHSAIARALEALADPKPLREAYEALASAATTETERAAYLVRMAEISEHRLGDDPSALRAYEEALLATPDESWILDRVDRVRARSPHHGSDPTHEPLDDALELVTRGEDPQRARALLETALATRRAPFAALRLLERLHRAANTWSSLAIVLAQQAEILRTPGPKVGALSAAAELEEWRLETEPDHLTHERILALAPDEPEALLAIIRARLPYAVHGDEAATRAVKDALRKRISVETGSARAISRLMLAHFLESSEDDGKETSERDERAEEALEQYEAVLLYDGSSVTAAWGQRRIAHQQGRTRQAAEACTVLADLTLDPRGRARYFVEAADMAANAVDSAGLGDARTRRASAALLLERALHAHPDGLAAAIALVALRTENEPPHDLLRVLREALSRANEKDSIIYLGTQVARIARDDVHDLGVATLAMRKVEEAAPTHAGSLLLLAELYLAQRAWPEAVATLEAVVVHATEDEPRLTALFALGSIYDKILARPEDHERVLRAALEIEPMSPRALRGVIDQLRSRRTSKAAMAERPRAETTELSQLLRRLAQAETDPQKQCDVYLEVSDLDADQGDLAGAERAILDAILHCPASARAFARLAAFFRRDGGKDAAEYARSLQDLISRGREAGLQDPRWFAALGQLEVDTLKRLHEGVAHLEWAIQLDPNLYETRYELADAYAKTGARDAALRTLLALVTPDARPLLALADAGVALTLLERTLEQEKRPGEAVVVSELRAVLGELDKGRADWLKSRTLAALDALHTPLGRQTLVEAVLPKPGRHVLLEVAAAASGLDSKLLRSNLTDLGVHSRDRVGARSTHALRPAFDRAVAALGLTDVELVVSPAVEKVRVAIQDVPWVLVPARYDTLPFGVQVAAFARPLAGILLGVPWLSELRDGAVLGWLIAVARQVVPGYALDEREAVPPDAAIYEPQVARAIGRKQRKALESLTAHLALRDGRLPEAPSFLLALRQCAARAAFIVSGDLTSTVRVVAEDDRGLRDALANPGLPALSALLAHPLAGDVARFALTSEASAICQRVGSSWAR